MSLKHKYENKPFTKGLVTFRNLTLGTIRPICESACVALQVDPILQSHLVTIGEKFLLSFIERMGRCNTPGQVRKHHDVCKRSYEELYSKMAFLIREFQKEEVQIAFVKADGTPMYGSKVQSNTYIHSYTWDACTPEVEKLWHKEPKEYRWLYQILGIVTMHTCQQISDFGYDETIEEALLGSFSYILTLGQVYNDVSCDLLIPQLEQEGLDHMIQEPLELDEEFIDLMDEVVEDMNAQNPPPYVRDLVRARKQLSRLPLMDDMELHLSTASSATYIKWKGKRISVPSCLAAQIEHDRFKDDPTIKAWDELIGFDPSIYRTDEEITSFEQQLDGGIEDYSILTITIPQHKLKRRVIHIGSNPIQDRLSYMQARLQEALFRYTRADSARDQDSGRLKAKKVSSDAEKADFICHSFDITDATGTNSQDYQSRVIEIMLGKVAREAWDTLMNQERVFKFANGKKVPYKANRGQPQGMEPSFSGLSIMHHFLLRMVMAAAGFKQSRPEDIYRITGDDMFCWYQDPNDTFGKTYVDLARRMGWEINLSKGYHYLPQTTSAEVIARYSNGQGLLPSVSRDYCVVEFCKQRYLKGKLFSPLPLELFGQSYREDSFLSLLLWLHRESAKGSVPIDSVINQYNLLFPELSAHECLYLQAQSLCFKRYRVGQFNFEPSDKYLPALEQLHLADLCAYQTLKNFLEMLIKRAYANKDDSLCEDIFFYLPDKDLESKLRELDGNRLSKLQKIADMNFQFKLVINSLLFDSESLNTDLALMGILKWNFTNSELDDITNAIAYSLSASSIKQAFEDPDFHSVLLRACTAVQSRLPYSVSRVSAMASSMWRKRCVDYWSQYQAMQ